MMFTWKTKTATQKLYWIYDKNKKVWILKHDTTHPEYIKKIITKTLAKIYWNEHSAIDEDIDYLMCNPWDSFIFYRNGDYEFLGYFSNLRKAMCETIYQVQKLGYI